MNPKTAASGCTADRNIILPDSQRALHLEFLALRNCSWIIVTSFPSGRLVTDLLSSGPQLDKKSNAINRRSGPAHICFRSVPVEILCNQILTVVALHRVLY